MVGFSQFSIIDENSAKRLRKLLSLFSPDFSSTRFLVKFSRTVLYNDLFNDTFEFIGRKKELEAALEFLHSSDKSILLITGNPGVGKSELMYEIARRTLGHFSYYLLKKIVLPSTDYSEDRAAAIRGIVKELTQIAKRSITLGKKFVLLVDDLSYYDVEIIESLFQSSVEGGRVIFKIVANFRDIFAKKIVDEALDRIYFSKQYLSYIKLDRLSLEEKILFLQSLQKKYPQLDVDEIINSIPKECNIREFLYRLYLIVNNASVHAYGNLKEVIDIIFKKKYFADIETNQKLEPLLKVNDYLLLLVFGLYSNVIKATSDWFEEFAKFRWEIINYLYSGKKVFISKSDKAISTVAREWSKPGDVFTLSDYTKLIDTMVRLKILIVERDYETQQVVYRVAFDDTLKTRLLELSLLPEENSLRDILPFSFSEVLPLLFHHLFQLSITIDYASYQLFEHKEYRACSFLLTSYVRWLLNNVAKYKVLPKGLSNLVRRINVLSPETIRIKWRDFIKILKIENLDYHAHDIANFLEAFAEQEDYRKILAEDPPRELIAFLKSFDSLFAILEILTVVQQVNQLTAKRIFTNEEFSEFLLAKIIEARDNYHFVDFYYLLIKLLRTAAYSESPITRELARALQDITREIKREMSKENLEQIIKARGYQEVAKIIKITTDLSESASDTLSLVGGLLLLDNFEKLGDINEVNNFVLLKATLPFDLSFLKFTDLKGEIKNENIIHHPLLLWPCVCTTPQLASEAKVKCAIHSLPDSNYIDFAFGRNITLVEYDNVQIYWINALTRWPPSIDSFIFCQTLIKNGYHNKRIQSILDIGCGTGILGTYLAVKNRNVSSVSFSDIEPSATKLATFNLKVNMIGKERDIEIKQYFGSGFYPISETFTGNEKPFDIIVCTPPYIPMFKREMPIASPAEGTGLLEEVVTYFSLYSDELLIGISHIAEPNLEHAIETTLLRRGIKLEKEKLNGDGIWVPLRIPWIKEDHLKELVEKRNLRIGSPYPSYQEFKYWHKIIVYRIRES